MREAFHSEHGGNLPDDLCSCIGNIPTQYEIRPADDAEGDELPMIDEDVLSEVCGSTMFCDPNLRLRRQQREWILRRTALRACESSQPGRVPRHL